ncbi:MAG: hypothetical protein N2253_01565 [Bacteroidia bacterium]|nr:hypothetical protein [Bacteroidia bacterium]MCX7763564.1 hypothetical protein [Bacteroidia bacterium]
MRETEWDWRGLWLGIARAEKAYLRIALVVLIAAIVWSLGGWVNRYNFSEVLIPFTFQEESIEPIQEVEVNFRSYLLEAPIRRAYEVYAADILLPRWQSFGIGWVFVVIGWAALLTAATRMEGFTPYLIYFAWSAWVFLSGSARAWVGVDPFYVVSLGLSLGTLLPIYLIGAGIWRLRLGLTWLLSVGLVGGSLGLPAFWQGLKVLYDSITGPAVIAYAAEGILGLHVPIALLTALVYPSFVRNKSMRGVWLLSLSSLGLIAALFLLPLEEALSLSVFITLLGILIGLVGLQPYYPIIGASLRQPAAFFWMWGGLGLIGVGTFGYHGWNHQDVYIYRVASLWWGMLIGGVGGMTLYLLWNFFPLWRAGKVKYWELHYSVRIPLAIVYFLALGSTILNEAQNDWPSTRLPARLYAIARAESALLSGRWEEAEALYREAYYLLPYEPKLNYNLGRLEAQRREMIEQAAERYERAILSKPFQPAVLQSSLVWLALDRPVRALQTLQRYYRRFGGDGVLCNQLGYAFYKVGQLDSAAYYWKEAIRQNPADPRPYAHLAILYSLYDKPTWATTVAQHIADWKNLSPAVQEDLAYLRLRGLLKEGSFRGWNAQWLGTDEDSTVMGRFVAALRRYQFREAYNAFIYLRENDPELAPSAARQLAVALLKAESPRRAAEIFLEARTPLDSLYAGYAFAESRCWDTAYALLSRLGAIYPELEELGRKESALLLMAAGRAQEASLIEPLSNWEDRDFLRFGYYAYLRGDIQTLVAVLRPWIDQGAAYDAPYEWVARLFLQQKDTSGADENIRAGLNRVPQSVRLRLLAGEIARYRGNLPEAQKFLDSARTYLRTSDDTLAWEAAQLMLFPEPNKLQQFLLRFPFYVPAQVGWAKNLLAQGKAEEAQKFLSEALETNPYAPELWAAYAEAVERLGMKEEAEFARQKPDPCPSVQ